MKTIKLKVLISIFTFIPVIAFAQLTETRKLESFDKVQSSGFFDVELEKGDQEVAKIMSTNFPLNEIIMEVDNGVLRIYKDKDYRPNWNAKVKIYLTYKNLEGIKNSGSGDVVCISNIEAQETWFQSSGSGSLKIEGTIKSNGVNAKNSGSGNIYLERVDAKNLHMEKSGSGNFGVHYGNVEMQELISSGSGNITVDGLVSNVCNIRISGSGNASINVSESLNAKISGSGNIRYKGSPSLNTKISGSGSIRNF